MSILNNEVIKFKRAKIRELLDQCTESQISMFNRMYGSIDLIPEPKMDRAYDQCLKTIQKNSKVI